MLAESHHKKASENLFYFLQFMERAGIGRKVQFWLDVERVRVNYGPLLNPNDGGGDVQHPGRDTNERELQLLDEIQRIHDTYLLYTDNIIQLHPKTHFAIKQLIGHYSNAESVATSVLSPAAQSRPDSPALITPTDRLCIVAAQEEVLRDMEANDFPAFLQSDSYFRWLADQERHQPEMAVDGDGGDEALSSTTTPQHGVTESTRASRQSGPFDAPTYNHGGSNMSDASAGASPINGGKLVASQTTISPEQRMDLDFNSADIMQMLKRNLRNILADTSVANAKEMYMHSTQPTRSTSSPYCPNSPVTASTSDRSRRSPSRALADLFSPSSSTRPSAVLNDISPFSELMVALDQAIDEGNGTTKSSSSPDAPPLNTSTSTARPADWSDLLDALLFQISLIEHMLKKDVGRSGFFDGVAACLERLEYADDATGSISTTARSEMLARLVRRVLARTRETLRRELAEILEKKMVVDRMDESEAVQLVGRTLWVESRRYYPTNANSHL